MEEDKDLTEEQRLKLQDLYETENPKPRNRAERRMKKYERRNKNKLYVAK